jgi:hypothetical protein
MAEFLSKATGTAVEWVQMVGMKVMHAFVVQDSSTDNVLIFSWLLILTTLIWILIAAWSGFHWNHRCFAQLYWRSSPSLRSCEP